MAGYDLVPKWWTLDCEECPSRKESICYWGTYRKKLVSEWPYGKIHKPKHCEFRNKPPINDLSWWNIPEAEEMGENTEKILVQQGRLL